MIVRLTIGWRKAMTLGFLACLAAGCATRPHAADDANHRVILVPGAGGWGADYAHFADGLRAAGVRDLDAFTWGSPIFLFNLQDRGVHRRAETALASRIDELLTRSPTARLDLIGHSAGCGVILGALSRLNDSRRINTVILLAPSVSPTYDLQPPLSHVGGRLHVFYSHRDQLFLNWRTSTFGTYDNVKTKAAGHVGFDVPPTLRDRVLQHPYDPAWSSLGDDGGHMGTLAEPFAKAILAPLLN